MLRIFNTKPYPMALHEEDIRRISVGVQYERHIETEVDIDGLRIATTPDEMNSCFKYRHQLMATIFAVGVVDMNRGMAVLSSTTEGSDEEPEAPAESTVEMNLGEQQVLLLDVEGALLTTEFLKDMLRLKSSKVDKVQQYCERVTNYIARAEKSSVTRLETQAQIEGTEAPAVAVLAAQPDADANMQALLQKAADTAEKIGGLIDREVEVSFEANKEEGIKAFLDVEFQAVEERIGDITTLFLNDLMFGESTDDELTIEDVLGETEQAA